MLNYLVLKCLIFWCGYSAHENEGFPGVFRKLFNPDGCHFIKKAGVIVPLPYGEDVSPPPGPVEQCPSCTQRRLPLPRLSSPEHGGMAEGESSAFFRGGNGLAEGKVK